MDVYVLFEIDPTGLGAYLGTFSDEEKAVENARVFLDAVLLYVGEEAINYDDVKQALFYENTVIITDLPNKASGVIIFKSEVDVADYSVK